MKIAVTGGTGFVGKAVVSELVRKGCEVKVLSRSSPEEIHPGTAHLIGNVATGEGLGDLVEGVHAVIHLVGIIREAGKSTFEAVHRDGTINVLQACKNFGVRRYLHMSALGTRQNARSRYHQSKWAAEEAVRDSGLKWTIFRPSIVFGPHDAFINMLFSVMKVTPVMPVPGGGKSLIQPVHVDDVAASFSKSLGPGPFTGKTYELGGPQVLSLKKIIKIMAKVTDKKRLYLDIPRPFLVPAVKIGELMRLKLPMTSDQLIMLEEDNIRTGGDPVEELGIEWTGFEEGIKKYLKANRE